MPPKFRNTVWVRRDNFVFLHPIAEGVRVRAEISHVLSTEDILYLRDLSLWPKYFEADAVVMTREAKRGNVSHNANIDEDMLPSASSSDEHESDG
jgi:probable RNA-binding protein EIF1AD